MNTPQDRTGGRQGSSGPRGAFVVLVGPDGVGKTTLARALLDREVDGSYFHFMPRPIARLRERPCNHEELVIKARGSGSRFLGILRISRNLLKAWLAYLLAVRPAVQERRLVVGDRWLYGYAAQPAALKFHGPQWFARFVLNLVPKPDLIVMLEALAQTIHDRKPELTIEEIEHEAALWASLKQPVLRLDANLDPDRLATIVLAHLRPPTQFVRYPPTLGHVLLPPSSRSAAVAGSSLYAPSRRHAYSGHRAGRWLIRSFGTGWLPRVSRDRLPLDPESWCDLVGALRAHGIPVDDVALYTRTQPNRGDFSLLVIAEGEPIAFVRVGQSEALDTEWLALTLLEATPPRSFNFPRLVARGSIGPLDYTVFTVVLIGLHRPAINPPLEAIVDQIQGCLQPLPQPPGMPAHWLPIHGDFTPWNLRQTHEGGPVLIDWESSGWGPPGADLVLYNAASSALGLPGSPQPSNREAADYWIGRIDPVDDRRDARLELRLVRALTALGEE